MTRNFPLAMPDSTAQNWHMHEFKEQMKKDLAGLEVWFWDDLYAEQLLQTFFPVESNSSIDFDLTEGER